MLLKTPRLYPKKRVSLFRLAMVMGFSFLLFMSRSLWFMVHCWKKSLRACGVSTRPARETERLLEYLGKTSEINGKTSEFFPKTWEIFWRMWEFFWMLSESLWKMWNTTVGVLRRRQS